LNFGKESPWKKGFKRSLLAKPAMRVAKPLKITFSSIGSWKFGN
jgi:hypothetical protein